MCTPKAPKVSASTTPEAKQPDPAVIRNPYLDNVTTFGQARMGRRQLRIDRGTPAAVRIPLPSSAQPAPSPAAPAPASGIVPTRTVDTPSYGIGTPLSDRRNVRLL